MRYEFKGTPGKWDIKETIYDDGDVSCQILSEMELGWGKWVGEAKMPSLYGGTKKECLANALAMSKAPEMIEMLKKIISLRDLIEYRNEIPIGNMGEAQAINKMFSDIEQLLKETTEI